MSAAWWDRAGDAKARDRDRSIMLSLEGIHSRLERIERKLGIIQNMEGQQMAAIDDVLVKVRAQTTLIDSIRAFIEGLKANGADPVVLAAIVAELDANNVALDLLDNTPEAPGAAPPA